MYNDQPVDDDPSAESMADFITRRRQEKANAALSPFAAHLDYGDAIRNGQDLDLRQPSDLMNYSARRVNDGLLGQVDPLPANQLGGGFGLQDTAQAQLDGGSDQPSPPSASPFGTYGDLNRLQGVLGYAGGRIGAGFGQSPLPADQFSSVELQGGRAQPASSGDQTSQPPGAQPGPSGSPARSDLHPGLAESLIPVWGSAKEAYADYKDGNYAGAALNGLLAGSDIFLGGEIAKAVEKGGLYALRGPLFEKAWRQKWTEVSKEMRAKGMLEPGQKGNFGKEGHHWGIPQRAKWAPDFIKNHPINIKELPKAVHRRITGRWHGAPQFNLLEQYWHGTPLWSKVATVDAVGHPITAATARDPDQ